jgi:hypothetical protein
MSWFVPPAIYSTILEGKNTPCILAHPNCGSELLTHTQKNNPLLIRGQKMKVIYCYMSNEAQASSPINLSTRKLRSNYQDRSKLSIFCMIWGYPHYRTAPYQHPLPSGNQTWQWKKTPFSSMIFPIVPVLRGFSSHDYTLVIKHGNGKIHYL